MIDNSFLMDSKHEDFVILHGDHFGLPDTISFLKSLAELEVTYVSEKNAEKKQMRERKAAATLFNWQEDIFVTRAPGRLDVMGGIADYSGSLVLQTSSCQSEKLATLLYKRFIQVDKGFGSMPRLDSMRKENHQPPYYRFLRQVQKFLLSLLEEETPRISLIWKQPPLLRECIKVETKIPSFYEHNGFCLPRKQAVQEMVIVGGSMVNNLLKGVNFRGAITNCLVKKKVACLYCV